MCCDVVANKSTRTLLPFKHILTHACSLLHLQSEVKGEEVPDDSHLKGHGGADYFLMNAFVRAVAQVPSSIISFSFSSVIGVTTWSWLHHVG